MLGVKCSDTFPKQFVKIKVLKKFSTGKSLQQKIFAALHLRAITGTINIYKLKI